MNDLSDLFGDEFSELKSRAKVIINNILFVKTWFQYFLIEWRRNQKIYD